MNKDDKQVIKGNDNNQINITINGDISVPYNKEEIMQLIKDYSFTELDKQKIVDEVLERIEAISYENRKRPEKRIFVPILQNLSYSLDDNTLKDTYMNLLQSSLDTTKIVHPSFVTIINQLNSDEIKLLNSLSPDILMSVPLLSIRLKSKGMQGDGHILVKYFSDRGFGVCDNPYNICAYLENLERLKLIEIPPYRHILNQQYYEPLKNHPAVLQKTNQYIGNDTFTINYVEQLFCLTQFGLQFLSVCKH